MLSIWVLAALLMPRILGQATITCFQCTTSWEGEDFNEACSDRNTTCEGYYCTKGPDARSNGMYRGCSNTPPVDNSAVAECRTVSPNLGNCYCNNIDFCNESTETKRFFLFIFFFVVLL